MKRMDRFSSVPIRRCEEERWNDRCLFTGAVALEASPGGCAYLDWEFGDCLNNTSYRPARNTIRDRSFAMIPLPRKGPNSGLPHIKRRIESCTHVLLHTYSAAHPLTPFVLLWAEALPVSLHFDCIICRCVRDTPCLRCRGCLDRSTLGSM